MIAVQTAEKICPPDITLLYVYVVMLDFRDINNKKKNRYNRSFRHSLRDIRNAAFCRRKTNEIVMNKIRFFYGLKEGVFFYPKGNTINR